MHRTFGVPNQKQCRGSFLMLSQTGYCSLSDKGRASHSLTSCPSQLAMKCLRGLKTTRSIDLGWPRTVISSSPEATSQILSVDSMSVPADERWRPSGLRLAARIF